MHKMVINAPADHKTLSKFISPNNGGWHVDTRLDCVSMKANGTDDNRQSK